MSHTATGLTYLGNGVITHAGLYSDSAPIKTKNEQHHEIFQHPARNWREATIGSLIDNKINTKINGWLRALAEHELAFFVLNHVRGVTRDTVCTVGASYRRKAIRVDGVEYRCLSGHLYERREVVA